MRALTMKFGGSSVGTTTGLTQLLSIVLHEHSRWDRLLLIVAALEGVTDALLEAAHLAQISNRRGYRRIAANIRTRHLAIAEKLPLGQTERSALQADIDQLLFDMLNLCEALSNTTSDVLAPDTTDAIISVGERLAARIIAALLRQNDLRSVAIDTTEIIVTDDVFGNATPNMALTRTRVNETLLPMLDRGIIPVLTGFIGGTVTGKPTTLGRGGSDYTASVLSVCAEVDEVWIWTIVDGIMTADPNDVSDAQVVAELSYEEMAELAYFGAKVLHSRMVAPLREHNIPLRVKNIYKPQQNGSTILAAPHHPRPIKAVTSIQGIGLSAHHSGSLARISQVVDNTLFSTIGTRADVMISAQSSTESLLCFVIPTSAGPGAVHTIQVALQDALYRHETNTDWSVQPVSVVTVIGTSLNGLPALIGRVLQTLDDVPLLALAQAARCSLSIVVEPRYAETALRRLHTLTVNSVLV